MITSLLGPCYGIKIRVVNGPISSGPYPVPTQKHKSEPKINLNAKPGSKIELGQKRIRLIASSFKSFFFAFYTLSATPCK